MKGDGRQTQFPMHRIGIMEMSECKAGSFWDSVPNKAEKNGTKMEG